MGSIQTYCVVYMQRQKFTSCRSTKTVRLSVRVSRPLVCTLCHESKIESEIGTRDEEKVFRRPCSDKYTCEKLYSIYPIFFPGEDERFPGESEEELAKMRRKRMIKKRSKLEESFPSYLQVCPSKFSFPVVLITPIAYGC